MAEPALAAATPRTPLLARLFARDTTPPVVVAPAGSRRSHLRQLYDQIGQFLFAHDLDLTPLNFGCVHDYVSGGDARLIQDIGAALRDQRISNRWIEDYVGGRHSQPLKPEMLALMAAQIERELDRCLGLMKRSADHARGYGDTLSAHAEAEPESSEALISRLVALTREMIDQTRLAESEMRASHRHANQLRSTLRAARKASEIDHLTGLPNRRCFERRVGERCAARRDGAPLALALCDVDHFKAVNDRFGHETGDRVLKFIANELRRLQPRGSDVARLGGEEFVILLPGRTIAEAGEEVDAMRRKIAGRNLVDSETQASIGTISFSAGIAAIADADDVKPAMRRADAALYAAKHAGRNRIYGARGEGQLEPLGD